MRVSDDELRYYVASDVHRAAASMARELLLARRVVSKARSYSTGFGTYGDLYDALAAYDKETGT